MPVGFRKRESKGPAWGLSCTKERPTEYTFTGSLPSASETGLIAASLLPSFMQLFSATARCNKEIMRGRAKGGKRGKQKVQGEKQ